MLPILFLLGRGSRGKGSPIPIGQCHTVTLVRQARQSNPWYWIQILARLFGDTRVTSAADTNPGSTNLLRACRAGEPFIVPTFNLPPPHSCSYHENIIIMITQYCTILDSSIEITYNSTIAFSLSSHLPTGTSHDGEPHTAPSSNQKRRHASPFNMPYSDFGSN